LVVRIVGELGPEQAACRVVELVGQQTAAGLASAAPGTPLGFANTAGRLVMGSFDTADSDYTAAGSDYTAADSAQTPAVAGFQDTGSFLFDFYVRDN